MLAGKSPCKMCGKCCHFEIPVTLLDIHRMAKHLGQPERATFRQCVQEEASARSSLFMIRKKGEDACIFLTDDNRCAIHEAKPRGCHFYECAFYSDEEALPWTAHCTVPTCHAQLCEQSVAAEVTKAYIRKNGARWNSGDYHKALDNISRNIADSDAKTIKLARDAGGAPLALIYDCSKCETRGQAARETPVTLDDIRRIAAHLRISAKAVFRAAVSPQASPTSGGLKLLRSGHCVFHDSEKGRCSIFEARPMHCRLVPCPRRVTTPEMADRLYLGSGTVEEQFRHQVSLAMTRDYVATCGTGYDKHVFQKLLTMIDSTVTRPGELKKLARQIAPYRYVDDTLLIASQSRGRAQQTLRDGLRVA